MAVVAGIVVVGGVVVERGSSGGGGGSGLCIGRGSGPKLVGAVGV